MVIQHPSAYPQTLHASAAMALLGEALFVAYQTLYPTVNAAPPTWKELDVQTRQSYLIFAKDMLEQLHLEQEERPSA